VYPENRNQLNMTIFKKDLLARYILAVLAFGLFSVTVVTSSHFAPKTERRLITLKHQVRRVLVRAERENLRSSAASDDGIQIDQPQRIGPASRSLEVAANKYNMLSTSRSLLEPASVTFDLSTILNL
jgi:hypothetical protein